MTLSWLIILAIWAVVGGIGTIPLIAWLLLIPFLIQDIFDGDRK